MRQLAAEIAASDPGKLFFVDGSRRWSAGAFARAVESDSGLAAAYSAVFCSRMAQSFEAQAKSSPIIRRHGR